MIYVFPLLLLTVGAAFWVIQKHRRQQASQYIDIGWAFFSIVLVYGLIPGIGLALAHLGVGELRDNRAQGGFDSQSIEEVQLTFLCFIVGFGLVYSLVRQHCAVAYDHREAANLSVSQLARFALILALALSVTKWMLGVQSATEYIETYLELASLPLIYRQVLGIASQLSFSALIAFVVFALASRPEAHLQVAVVLALYLAYATLAGGSRMYAFLSFFAYLVAASIYVRGFSMAKIIPLAILALVLFMVAGILRAGEDDASYLDLFQSGEFTALFVNAIDLNSRLGSGFGSRFQLPVYTVDVLRLIPAQLLQGVKSDPAVWYVSTFYPSYFDAGGGFAFGLIAEATSGFGAPEAFGRGVLLALVFAWAGNRLMGQSASPTRVFVYVWLVVLSYQCFRDTTLTLVTRGMYQVLPLLLIIRLSQMRRSAVGPMMQSSS